jgi:hypothetical protein
MLLNKSSRSTRSTSLFRLSLLVLGFALAMPSGVLAATGPATAPPTANATAPAGDFSINLYRKGDFVSQATPYWCIGASMQMMLNMVGVTEGDSRDDQERNMLAARSRGRSSRISDHGQDTDVAGGALRGAGSSGWARGLVELGARYYGQRAVDGYGAAVRIAAEALRRTNRPVGLIVWRGAHAWVMSGFTATADPLVDPDYRVTGVYIQDPWYPRVSSIWGPGQDPNSWISINALKEDFLPRRGGQRHADQAGKYVLVLPFDPPRRAVRRDVWMI